MAYEVKIVSVREQAVKKIRENKIIAIFRNIEVDKCVDAAKALYAGGIRVVEVTFNQKEADEKYYSTVESIKRISQAMDGDMCVGAGTVLTLEEVLLAYNAGARFIIMPNTDAEIIKFAGDLDMAVMPGAYTASEVNNAYNAGADFVKIFPASMAGAKYFKAVSGPLGHIPLTAVGGVDENNAREFLEAGAVGLGIGGNLADKKLIAESRYDELTEIARRYINRIREDGR